MMKQSVIDRISVILEFPKIIYYRYIKKLHFPHLIYNLKGQKLINNKFKTVIDVGGADGDFTKTSMFLNKDCKVYTFEPQLNQYNKIKEINKDSFNFGLSDKEEIKKFYIRKNHLDSSSLYNISSFYNNEEIEEREIITKRGDNIDIEYNSPVLLKIDVEGYELEVIKGFGDKLKEIDIVVLELGLVNNFDKILDKFGDIVKLLSSFGFTGFIQLENGYTDVKPYSINIPGACDIMFFKSDLSKEKARGERE